MVRDNFLTDMHAVFTFEFIDMIKINNQHLTLKVFVRNDFEAISIYSLSTYVTVSMINPVIINNDRLFLTMTGCFGHY